MTQVGFGNIIPDMNEMYSGGPWTYKKRWLAGEIRAAVEVFPVVVVTGARQVGKSTLLREEFPEFTYRTLDDFATLAQAREDPASLWKGAEQVVIDEVQKVPELFSAIKLTVDTSERRCRFLLSGSANLLLLEKVSESLAGRAVYFDLLPMSCGEMRSQPKPSPRFANLWDPSWSPREHEAGWLDPLPRLLRGFMPPLLELAEDRNVLLWWEGYVRTYVERDLRELSQIDSLVDFRRFLSALALRTGTVLNQSELARELGISQPTVHRYVKLLEVSNLVARVPPFFSSRTKRIVKTPKVFLVDPGLSVYLSGYHDAESLQGARELGRFFETLVFLHLRIASGLTVPHAKLFFWRTGTGKEVDFVLEKGRDCLAFEVKLTQNPSVRDAVNLLSFLDESPQTVRGVLLHGGTAVKWVHSRVLAIPWWWPWLEDAGSPEG